MGATLRNDGCHPSQSLIVCKWVSGTIMFMVPYVYVGAAPQRWDAEGGTLLKVETELALGIWFRVRLRFGLRLGGGG